jgi:hypothetical protein
MFGWLSDEPPTEHIPHPEPVEEWPVVEYLEADPLDPLDLIAGWRDADDETPILLDLLAGWEPQTDEEAA